MSTPSNITVLPTVHTGRRRARATRLVAGMAIAMAGLSLGPASAAPVYGVVDLPIDLHTTITRLINPGGTQYSNEVITVGDVAGSARKSEQYYEAPRGVNWSGRGQSPLHAFASALSESSGNGGVGVSSLLFGPAIPGMAGGYEKLVAQASWTQIFDAAGPMIGGAQVSAHFSIPELTIGLLGVPPNRDSPSTTETAEATADLWVHIQRANGSVEDRKLFEYGLRTFEVQYLLGPGVFGNFADIEPIGSASGTVTTNNDPYNPTFSLAARDFDLVLGDLYEGDTLSYIYQLTAQGSTNGYEHGYQAFLGDPFGVNITSGNLVPTITPLSAGPGTVPEPGSAALALLGLAALTRRRRAAKAPSPAA